MFQKKTIKDDIAAVMRAGTILVFLLLTIAGVALAGEVLSENEQKELYSQGKEFFRQATEISASNPAAAKDLYAKALIRFNRLVDEGGVRNGKLFYNIGNINFLLEDTGRAILNYRRAEQYIPNDSNLVKNLAYARNIRLDRLEVKDQKKIQQTLFFFHFDLGTKTRLILFSISYLIFWIFVGIKIFSQRPYTTWVLTISLLFTLIFGISLYVERHQSVTSFEGVILDPEVIARQGDAESYQPSFEDPLHA
jgi:tetratricopeptide (TPR) repeat protein